MMVAAKEGFCGYKYKESIPLVECDGSSQDGVDTDWWQGWWCQMLLPG